MPTAPRDVGVELAKIARLLGIDPDDVAYLAAVPLDELRILRDVIADQVLDATGDRLDKLAHAARSASRRPIQFVADVATAIDPRRSGSLLSQVSVSSAIALGDELVRRAEYGVLGRLISAVNGDTLHAAVDALDDEVLLRAAITVGDARRRDELLAALSVERMANLVHVASDHGLWNDALELVGHLPPEHRVQLAELAASREDTVLAALVSAATS